MTPLSQSAKYGTLLATALLVGLFVVSVRAPLSHTDLWGHLAYGRYFSETGRFPPSEPFLALSHDEPFVTTSWLSQWLGFQIHRVAGPLGLQFSYAILCTATFASLYWLTVKQTGQPWIGLVAMLIFGALEYQQLLVIRPQLTGMLCFCLLLVSLHSRSNARLSIGVLMLFWANLHGSFAIGPVVIGLFGAGECLDRLRKTDSDESLSPRSAVRETAILVAIALLAGMLNPYGLALYREVMTFSAASNLENLIEWKPLWSTPKQGTVFVVAWGLGLLAVACSKRPFRWRVWLPVLVLAAMTLKTSRYIVWFGPLYVYALAPHLRQLLDAAVSRSKIIRTLVEFSHREVSRGPRIVLVMIAIGVCVVPVSRSSPYGPRTPINATDKLLELPEQTLILNTMEWGDWMIWRSRSALPVFVNSHVTFIPPDVWQDYMTLIKLKLGWEAVLEKYPFSAAVLQNGRQRRLIRKLEQHPAWMRIHRDEIAVIYVLAGEE